MELLGNISSDRITIDELRIMLIDIILDFTSKVLKRLPSVKPELQKPNCNTCKGLESDDTLYSSSDLNSGIDFDYIRDIKYCPVGGSK